MGQAYSEVFPPKAKWLPKDIPDLTGKVIIVTGGNSGIGKTTIKYLLLKNCTVYLLARASSKTEAAIADLTTTTKHAPHFIPCDLSDLTSVKAAAAEFEAKEQKLDVLINSAGVMCTPMDQLTKQGYDMQFGTNVLGHAYLTMQLLPLLLSTAKSAGQARIVTVASNGDVGIPGGLDFASMRDGPVRRKNLTPWKAYWQSKWGGNCFSQELARRYGSQGLVCVSLNPGVIRTELGRNLYWMLFIANMMAFDMDPWGAINSLYAATAPEAGKLNGQFLIPFARPGKARADCYDPALGKALWEWVEEQVKGI